MSVYSGTFSLAHWAFQSCCHEQRQVESVCLSTVGLIVWQPGLCAGTYSLAAWTFLSVDVGLTKMTTCINMSVCYRTYSLALWAFLSCCHEQRQAESVCLSTLGLSVWHTGLFCLVAMNKDKLNQYVYLLWDFQSSTLGYSIWLTSTKLVELVCLSTLGLSVWHSGLFYLININKDKLN